MNHFILALGLFSSVSAFAFNHTKLHCDASGLVDGITAVDASMDLYNTDTYTVNLGFQDGSTKNYPHLDGDVEYGEVMIATDFIEATKRVKQTFVERDSQGIYTIKSVSSCDSSSDGDCIGSGHIQPSAIPLSVDTKVTCVLSGGAN
jgi:hypothetical protein